MESNDKTCNHCTYWEQGHNVFEQEDEFGHCHKLGDDQIDPEFIIPVLNNGQPVTEKVNHFEFVTGAKFGCNHWKENQN
jgi:hypothetical protein